MNSAALKLRTFVHEKTKDKQGAIDKEMTPGMHKQ